MTTPPHLGGAHLNQPDFYTWLPDIWEQLILKYQIKSVLDVGCGAGFSTAWFQARAGKVLGIEGDSAAHLVRKCDPIVRHDFSEGPFIPVDIYDLGWCAEFVEHVEARFMRNWMRALQQCRYVCITFARPGQGGHHHVNEQEEPYWLERFGQAGLDHLPEETERMRATGPTAAWGRPTLTFFRNRYVGHPDPSWLLQGM
jgi:SAM-dependent methyltransferase